MDARMCYIFAVCALDLKETVLGLCMSANRQKEEFVVSGHRAIARATASNIAAAQLSPLLVAMNETIDYDRFLFCRLGRPVSCSFNKQRALLSSFSSGPSSSSTSLAWQRCVSTASPQRYYHFPFSSLNRPAVSCCSLFSF